MSVRTIMAAVRTCASTWTDPSSADVHVVFTWKQATGLVKVS